MGILKKLVMAVLLLIVLLLVGSFFLPSEFSATRSQVINAPAQVIFEQIDTLQKNEAWSPWRAADPTMVTTYNDIPSGVGASYSWTGEASGSGTYTITESVPHSRVAYNLTFDGQAEATGDLTLEPAGDGVRVTWTFGGDAGMNPIGRYMGLAMDSLVGAQFESGLNMLKEIAEAAPVPEPEPEPAMTAEDAAAEGEGADPAADPYDGDDEEANEPDPVS